MTTEELARVKADFDTINSKPQDEWQIVDLSCMAALAILKVPLLLAEVERWRNVVDEIQEYVVAHAFDTTVGRKIDDFITERLKALASDALQ